MGLYKGKWQIKKYSDVVADEKIDRLQPATHKNQKYFKLENLSGSLGKRDSNNRTWRPYKTSVSRSIFTGLQKLRSGSIARDTTVGPGEIVEHKISNPGPFRSRIIIIDEYDIKPATASLVGIPASSSGTIARGSYITASNTSTGSISAASWSFFPTADISRSDGTPIGRYGLFRSNPFKFLVRTGSDIYEDIIIGTGPSIGGSDAQQVVYIKVEGDYLDSVTYDSIPHAWTFS